MTGGARRSRRSASQRWFGAELEGEGIEIARANPELGANLGAIADHARTLSVVGEVIEAASAAPDSPWRDATLAMALGELEQAVEFFERVGIPLFEAEVRLAAAERLFEGGATADGVAELEKAPAFFRSVGATFFLDRGEALLREAKSA